MVPSCNSVIGAKMIRYCCLLFRKIRLLCRGIRYEIGRLIEEQREREVPPAEGSITWVEVQDLPYYGEGEDIPVRL